MNLPYLSECELSRELTLNHDVEDRVYLCRVVNLMNPWKDVTVQYRVDSWGGKMLTMCHEETSSYCSACSSTNDHIPLLHLDHGCV